MTWVGRLSRFQEQSNKRENYQDNKVATRQDEEDEEDGDTDNNKSKQQWFCTSFAPYTGPRLYCKLLDPFKLLLALQPMRCNQNSAQFTLVTSITPTAVFPLLLEDESKHMAHWIFLCFSFNTLGSAPTKFPENRFGKFGPRRNQAAIQVDLLEQMGWKDLFSAVSIEDAMAMNACIQQELYRILHWPMISIILALCHRWHDLFCENWTRRSQGRFFSCAGECHDCLTALWWLWPQTPIIPSWARNYLSHTLLEVVGCSDLEPGSLLDLVENRALQPEVLPVHAPQNDISSESKPRQHGSQVLDWQRAVCCGGAGSWIQFNLLILEIAWLFGVSPREWFWCGKWNCSEHVKLYVFVHVPCSPIIWLSILRYPRPTFCWEAYKWAAPDVEETRMEVLNYKKLHGRRSFQLLSVSVPLQCQQGCDKNHFKKMSGTPLKLLDLRRVNSKSASPRRNHDPLKMGNVEGRMMCFWVQLHLYWRMHLAMIGPSSTCKKQFLERGFSAG